MIDIISLIIALSGLAVGILSHIRHSKCSNCIEIDTKTPQDEKQFLLNKK